MRAFSCWVASFVLLLVCAARAHAAPPVPPPLEPWREWVLQGQTSQLCAKLAGEAEPQCIWPARLALQVDARRGTFTLDVQVDVAGFVRLPGDAKRWPVSVTVDRHPAAVVAQAEVPVTYLEPGRHAIAGELVWSSIPESIPVPREIGMVSLHNAGALVEFPNRDDNGVLWLQKSSSAVEGDQLEFTVHRKIVDEVPLELTTRLSINVAGKSREVLLGKVLPAEFVPQRVDSPIPARLEPDGRLRVQVRPGSWTITVVARSRGPVERITRPDPEGIWREGDEVWAFEARNDLRIVSVDGAPSIDPGQTSLPPEWRSLPAFAVGAGGALSFHERQRGDANPAPDRLHLARTLWLDFDGNGFTFRDALTGALHRSWRLEMGPKVELGRVSIANRDVHITRLGEGAPAGVEVRQGALRLEAEGRFARTGTALPAALWSHDFEGATLKLALPPGWELLHASGVDAVSDSWIHRWRLLEIFVALVLAVAFFRLFGRRWGLLALAAMVASLTVPGAPRWSWFLPLGLEAIARVARGRLGEGKLRTLFDLLRVGSIAALAIVLIPFAVHQVRGGMFPALEQSDADSAWQPTLADRSGASAPASEMPAEDAPVAVPEPSSMEEERSAEGYRAEQEDARRAAATKSRPMAPGASKAPRPQGEMRQFNTSEYDPNAVVQVGPGVPSWSWSSLQLVFNGPVRHDQTIQLYLLPPLVRLPLALLRVALLALLFVRLLASAFPRFAPKLRGFGPAPAVLAILLGVSVAPQRAHAQELPSREMLEELRARLLAAPPCADQCAEISRMWLEVTGKPARLRARLEVAALAPAAVPLPGRLGQWTPSLVLLDDKPAALRRSEDGRLLLDVPVGTHRVELSGALPAQASVPIELPRKPRVASAELTEGWTLDGLHEDGRIDDTLQLTRTERDASGSELQAGTLPSFVRVERTLHIGLNWQLETRVVRLSPLGTAIALEIPLLAGESVTTADVRVERGKVIAQLPRDATELAWQSVLAERSPILLTAARTLDWTERWQLDVSPMWHAELSGLPVAHQQSGGVLLPDWRPWPGEEARIDIRRPEGIGGQTLAIDSSTTIARPGLRSTDMELSFQMRASRGGEHAIELPEGSDLQSVTVRGASLPLRLEGRTLTLPVRPGVDTVVVRWREPRGIGVWFSPSAVDLKVPSVNATVRLELADQSRWILFLTGPRLGPAVLFWSFLVVLLLVAYGLSRARRVPLKMWEWVLLGIGISQTSPWAAAAFAGWLLALAWRGTRTDLPVTAHRFVQIALVFWTVIALFVLLASIHQGLLGFPSMRIEGNDSTASSLRWYVDRVGATLPAPRILSVPILVYRLAMLSWALWLAFAVMRWVRWGFESFLAGGGWKSKPARTLVVPAAQVPAEQEQASVEGAPAEGAPPPPPRE